MEKEKYRPFSFMILIVIFFIGAVAVSACLAVYFVHSGKIITADIERYTQNYSITLAETLSETASDLYDAEKTPLLQDFFYNRINKDIIDEAFFVLNNGKIILHSETSHSESLGGNIGNNEFAYNLELILRPALQNTKEVLFTSYNIIGRENPFDFAPRIKKFMKQYIYSGIDSTGWLTSKAVFHKNKPIGTISFIISKQKVFDAIIERFEEIKKYWKYGIAGSTAFSFLIALIFSLPIKRRYIKPATARKPRERFAKENRDDYFAIDEIENFSPQKTANRRALYEETEEITEREFDEEFITIDISYKTKGSEIVKLEKYDLWELESDEIQDAIPIRKKTLW